MVDVFNAVRIGFEWAQDLQLGEGMVDAGDSLRADFRYLAEDAVPIFSIATGDGIDVDDLLVSLVVSGDRTGLITAPDPKVGWRFVYADLVKVPASGPEEHMGFRLRVPAVLPVTRAQA